MSQSCIRELWYATHMWQYDPAGLQQVGKLTLEMHSWGATKLNTHRKTIHLSQDPALRIPIYG